MRKSLIAIALAGSLAAGLAGAQGMTLHPAGRGDVSATPVQYYERHNDDRDRWQHDVRSAPAIDEREARLGERIERGLHSGRLTRQEAWQLRRQLEHVQARERDFLADGRLSRWEERELARHLDAVAVNIRTQMRDEDRRY